MAVAPRKAKRSPAQVRAGQAFAAGGRAAQAASRAAAKKAGKKPAVSKARHQAAQQWAAAGRAAQAARRAGNRAVTPRARAAVAPEELLARPGSSWPAGCNDVLPTCAAVAVACHLQAATGFVLPEAEVLKLHILAGDENGATIGNVLEAVQALQSDWFAFAYGRVRLLSFFRADEQLILAGMVVGVRLPHAGHAVLAAPGGMISWGREMPWDGEPEEAWCLEWGM